MPTTARSESNEWVKAATIGALTGVRSMAAVRAALPGRRLARSAAWAESVADKLPFIGARTQPLSLVARAALGGWAASAIAGAREDRGRKLALAAVGAAAAVGTTYAICGARTWVAAQGRLRSLAAGLAEDGLVSWLGRRWWG
jgi:uncharacterized membrane protein